MIKRRIYWITGVVKVPTALTESSADSWTCWRESPSRTLPLLFVSEQLLISWDCTFSYQRAARDASKGLRLHTRGRRNKNRESDTICVGGNFISPLNSGSIIDFKADSWLKIKKTTRQKKSEETCFAKDIHLLLYLTNQATYSHIWEAGNWELYLGNDPNESFFPFWWNNQLLDWSFQP